MNVVFIHGWLGHAENFWFSWLRQELEHRGHRVIAPTLPCSWFPRRRTWQPLVEATFVDPANTVLVGHSFGCAALLHALHGYHGPAFAHVVCVAGFGRNFLPLLRLGGWFATALDFSVIRSRSRKWTCIHSDNDPLVPLREGEWLAEHLGTRLVPAHGSHFNGRRPEQRPPRILEEILSSHGESSTVI